MDFFIRDARSLIPVEVKTTDSATKSLTKLTAQDGKYPNIRYGIKLCNKNIGFNGRTRQTLWGGRTDANPKLSLNDT